LLDKKYIHILEYIIRHITYVYVLLRRCFFSGGNKEDYDQPFGQSFT
jgi:hypothetical protein